MNQQPLQETRIYGPFANAHHFQINNSQFIYNHIMSSEDVQQQLERKLKPIPGAWLDKDKICLEGTRVAIIEEISTWINTNDENVPRTFFLCGEAGTGKSTISHTIGQKFEKCLGGFFCFNRTYSATRTPINALRTLAYKLGINFPDIGNSLVRTFEANPNILESTSVQELWKTLIVDSARMIKNPFQPVLIVIDALDESGEKEGPREKLLSVLLESTHYLPRNFHVFITSRPESDILAYLTWAKSSPDLPALKIRYMQSIPGTDEDIFKYVCSRMMKRQALGVLDQNQCKILAEKAAGFFQWASIVCTSLQGKGKGGLSIKKRFTRFMSLSPTNSKELNVLDTLYESILKDAFDVQDEDAMVTYKIIMSQILAAFEPLSQSTLRKLQVEEEDEENVDCVLAFLGSLFTGVSESDMALVKPVHTSVRDFLLDNERSKQFSLDLNKGHSMLAKGALNAMTRDLHFNMCNLESSHPLNSEIMHLEEIIQKGIPPEISYACCFWDLHLQKVKPDNSWLSLLKSFFHQFSLYWMEILGLIKRISVVTRAAVIVKSFLNELENTNQSHELFELVQEIPQFVQVFGKTITDATPHLYLSCIPFIPKHSVLLSEYAKHYHNIAMLSGNHINTWPSEQAILWGHTDEIASVAFSPDGKKIVSGSWDRSIRIWNAETGEAIGEPLQGHSHWVSSVAFYPDGKKIVSGSWDKSVRIWDAGTGKAVGEPLLGHIFQVTSVAVSPDGKKIVSGGQDKLVKIWNAETGEAIGEPLQGHSDYVTSVAFSSDGNRIMSGSSYRSVRIWDAETGKAVRDSPQEKSNWVTSVAFSPNGKRSVSGYHDNSLRIWDTEIGEAVGNPLQGHAHYPISVAFSPDGRRIASGSHDKLVKIWNAETGKAIGGPLSGHSFEVSSVAFSPDGKRLVSGSRDKSIRIWNAETEDTVQDLLQGHLAKVTSVAFSPDGRWIVSGSEDYSVRIWDAKTGKAVGHPFLGHSLYVTSVAFSPDSKKIISGSWDCSVRIWDAETGEPVGNPLKGHLETVNSVAFSPDGKRIVSGSVDKSLRIWNTETGGVVGDPLKGHSDRVTSVAFSPDGTIIVSGSFDKSVRVWNTETGNTIGDPMLGHSQWINSVAFSPNGKKIVSGSWDKSVRIWNAETGEAIGELKGHLEWVNSVAFSPNGKIVVSASWDKSVRTWDVETGKPIGNVFQGHSDSVTAVAFSPDGTTIVSGSLDKSVRIWDNTALICTSPKQTGNKMLDSPINHCYLDHEGWLHGSDSSLILWIPPKYQPTIAFPPMKLVISPSGSSSLDLSNFVYGSNWVKCIKQE